MEARLMVPSQEYSASATELSHILSVSPFGQDRIIKGGLVMLSADTLASNWAGGFKEGVSFALKNCRVCELENKKLSSVFSESCVSRRSCESHTQRLEHLDHLSMGTPQAKQYWSKLWGINSESCLLDAPYFDIISCLAQIPCMSCWKELLCMNLRMLFFISSMLRSILL